MKRRRWGLALCLALGLGAPGAAAAAPVLRVGLVDGSPPCSYREAGVWRGLGVDLWNRVATLEEIPYVVSQWPSVRQMLEASREGKVDVAVGCINVSPDRLKRYRFSLPFQEDGLAVMVVKSRLDLGRSFLAALLTPTLLQLLGGYLLAIAVLSAEFGWGGRGVSFLLLTNRCPQWPCTQPLCTHRGH